MKASTGFTVSTFVAAIIGLAAVSSAHAVPVIVNGGFESGFTSWTIADQVGSDGTFFIQSGTSSPLNGEPVPAPPGGTNAAMTDAFGPGSHVLYQDFVVTAGGATLSFALFIGNRADRFVTANPATVGLDFSTPALNQQARVDIMQGGTNPFSVAAADVLLNLYQTNPGDPLESGYDIHTFDVSALFAAHIGDTLRLRFAETDNVFIFNFGVDNVSIDPAITTVPEPASTLLFGATLAALLAIRFGIRSRRVRP